MSTFFQQIITGISVGGLYSLLAVGYALIYSVFSFTNFGFGGIMMMSAFGGYFALRMGLSLPLAFVAAAAVGISLSVITELLAYRPMRNRGASRLFLMISAMGVGIVVENSALLLFGANLRTMSTDMVSKSISLGRFQIGLVDFMALVVSCLSLAVLWWFLYKTRAGITVRASAIDMMTSGLMGVNVNRVSLIVFAISGITASIAGMFFGMKYTVYPAMGSISTKAFIASVIGGLGSLPGAVVGGFVLGVMETFVAGYISSTYRDLISFLVMIIVLMFVPNGMFGKGSQEKL